LSDLGDKDEAAPERAYRSIRHDVLSGRFQPGNSLPEERFAAELGLSRTPVREALRRLGAEGLVEILPNRGARVPIWTPTDVDAIFDLRLRLEGYAARLAAARSDRQAVADLTVLAETMERQSRTKRGVQFDIPVLNNEFHLRIVDASGSPRLLALTANVVSVGLVSHTFRVYTSADLQRSMHHHREIVDAIEHGEPEWAESVMRSHLLAARCVLRANQAIDGSAPPPV
jgi:DNA-binding GntR family transcriptional regulator